GRQRRGFGEFEAQWRQRFGSYEGYEVVGHRTVDRGDPRDLELRLVRYSRHLVRQHQALARDAVHAHRVDVVADDREVDVVDFQLGAEGDRVAHRELVTVGREGAGRGEVERLDQLQFQLGQRDLDEVEEARQAAAR